jgi:acyl-CoA synthetase (AMP-forming)/AMP-acid ligase II
MQQMNIASLIEQSCKENADKFCVVDGDHRLTYRDMEERANRLARALVEMGVEPGDRVGIFLTNCFQYIEMFYAITKIGAIFVSLNFRLREKETTYILNNAEAKILIMGERYVNLMQSIQPDLSFITDYIVIGQAPPGMKRYEEVLASHSPEPYPVASIPDDATFTIIYTSGTTGLPKGAMLTHANLISAFEDAAATVPEEQTAMPSGTTLVNVPMYHIAGVLAPLGAIRGENIVILSRFDPGVFLETIEREKVVSTYVVPTMLRAILDHPDFSKRDLSSLQNILYGAAPMPIKLIRRALKVLPANYTNTFGLTEGFGTISSLTPEDHRLEGDDEEIKKKMRRLSGVGKAIPGYELRVVDARGRDVRVGEVGEVLARGKRIMKGYWNNPEATKEAIRDGWLHTGDLVSMDEDGYLYLGGRTKDMINRAGENIYPIEIEETLHSHPKVVESAVIGVPDEYWGEIVKAVIVLKPGERATPEEIIEFCRGRLASYKKPSIVEFVEELPKNALGKVLKSVLRGEDLSINRGEYML